MNGGSFWLSACKNNNSSSAEASLTLVNGIQVGEKNKQLLRVHDKVQFPCDRCYMPHLYHISGIFNEQEESKVAQKQQSSQLFKPVIEAKMMANIVMENNKFKIAPRELSRKQFPQERFFQRHLTALISPVGYEDDFTQTEKAHASGDFISSGQNGATDFVDISAETGLWSSNLKESLKKYLFLFGFGRLDKMRKVSDVLSRQPLDQLQAYANSFIKMIYENLPQEYENELKKFLGLKINYNISIHMSNSSKNALVAGLPDNPEDSGCSVNEGVDLKFWGGDKILPQIVAWSRRLLLLDILQRLLVQYKRDRASYLERPVDQQDWRVSQLYRTRDNMVNFCTEEQLMGMKPATWWQRSHDVDLLQGTYKYGFANYISIKEDKKLGWNDVINQSADQQDEKSFPSPESLTKRLKKLLSIALRVERFNFEKVSIPEKTGLNFNEKTQITKILADVGIDCSKERPFQILKTKVAEKLQKPVDANERQLEKFISQLSNEANRMVREYNKRQRQSDKLKDEQIKAEEEEKTQEQSIKEEPGAVKQSVAAINEFKVQKEKELKLLEQHADLRLVKFDPDNDGFNFGIVEAFKVHKRTIFFNFIRKTLFQNQAKGFTEGAEALLSANELLEDKNVCDGWETPKQDLALLMAIGDKGVGYLRQVKYHGDDYGLSGIKMNKKKLLKRAEWVCQVYKNYFMSLKTDFIKRQEAREQEITANLNNNHSGPRLCGDVAQKVLKASNLNVRTDSEGNIIYPIVVTGTLKVLNLGVIDPTRNLFHSPSNIFPIGFKSVREAASIHQIGLRAEYTCEILDDGSKPMFKVTCSEEPNTPIIRDSASGCWLDFIKRTNDIQSVRKAKPSVSGPDRFGLAEPSVLKIIQSLPNADRCQNFRRKQFVQR